MDIKLSDTELAAIKCIKRGKKKLAIATLMDAGWNEVSAYSFVNNRIAELNTKGGEENGEVIRSKV